MKHDAYGNQLASYFRIGQAPCLTIDSDDGLRLSMTRLRSATGTPLATAEVIPNRAFTIPVHLTGQTQNGWKTWIDGQLLPIDRWDQGGFGIFDLQQNPTALRPSAFDCVHYFLPRSTVDAYTDGIGAHRISDFVSQPGKVDHVLSHLAQMITPILGGVAKPCQLFLDNYLLMFCSYLTGTFGKTSSPQDRFQGGLAPWQKRLVEELLRNNLRGNLKIGTIAAHCGISSGHLSRCFKRSFGTTLHQYLILQRIEEAKTLLINTELPLLDIAFQAGFSDQAAFSRAFGSFVGTTPARWRKERVSTMLLAQGVNARRGRTSQVAST